MDWTSIITIVLGSGLLSAALNNVAAWWLKRSERTNQATFIALNIAHQLEQYAYDCLSAAFDHDNAESSHEHVGSYIRHIPDFPELPTEDYRVFNLELLDEIMDFRKQVIFANESLDSAFEHLDGQDAIAEGYKSTLKLARESLKIADSVRSTYKLKKRKLEFAGYSVRRQLMEKLAKVNL